MQATLAQLSWYHNVALLEKLKTPKERLWYATKAYEYGWSRNILAMQIEMQAHLRLGKAQNNFLTTLPPTDSDMATQIFVVPILNKETQIRMWKNSCSETRPKNITG